MNMDKYLIRRAKEEDYKSIKELVQQLQNQHVMYDPLIFKKNDNILSFENYINKLTNEIQYYTVVEDTYLNKVIAVAIWEVKVYRETIKTNSFITLYIDNIVVYNKYRRQGVGKMLLRYLEQYAKEEGIDTLSLKVNAHNYDVMEFYKKNNFEEEFITMRINIR